MTETTGCPYCERELERRADEIERLRKEVVDLRDQLHARSVWVDRQLAEYRRTRSKP